MLERIQLDNFLSHGNTTFNFDHGVTVFVGSNGSGKSSIIDAITFALYGKHTRGHNSNLIRRGSTGTMIQLTFGMNSKRYQVTRSLDSKGSLIGAKLEQITDNGIVPLAYGERKQMGESMSDETSNIIGLDYERLKVAAVVQQGELNAILQKKPSEFKELLNSLIGIDRLDIAFETMKEVLDSFKSMLRNKTGFDYDDIDNLEERTELAKKELEESSKELVKLHSEMEEVRVEEKKIKEKLAVLEPLSSKVKELDDKKTLLRKYLQQKITELHAMLTTELSRLRKEQSELKKEIGRTEKIADDVKENLDHMLSGFSAESEHKTIEKQLHDFEKKLQNYTGKIGKLQTLVDNISDIEPREAKCPVCGTSVGKITVEIDSKHVEDELDKITKMKEEVESQIKKLRVEKDALIKKQAIASRAIRFLNSYGIKNATDIKKLRREIAERQTELQKLPSQIENIQKRLENLPSRVDDDIDLTELIDDDYARDLHLQILDLEKTAAIFNQEEFEELKVRHDDLMGTKIPSLERNVGKVTEINEKSQRELDSLEKILEELKKAGTYANLLDKMRKKVYYRDGNVAKSLRSWALKTISQKASEYTAMFNMNISRLQLTEKARDISIECYGRSGAIDMESLSGGEKVAIALALRLGMAYVMGSGKLDFVILDEPTTHLDEERRKSLVRIITEAFRSGLGPLSQMILITHDSEIFENAEVDSVYRFTMSNEGTHVERR